MRVGCVKLKLVARVSLEVEFLQPPGEKYKLKSAQRPLQLKNSVLGNLYSTTRAFGATVSTASHWYGRQGHQKEGLGPIPVF